MTPLDATQPFDTNLLVNLFTLAVLIVFAVPVLRSRRKDGVIAEQEKVIKSHELRVKALIDERNEARDQVAERDGQLAECGKQIAALEAKYAEQSKYTARDALESVRTELVSQQRTMKTAVDSLGELVQKDIEVTARLVGALEGQGVQWTRSSSSRSHED